MVAIQESNSLKGRVPPLRYSDMCSVMLKINKCCDWLLVKTCWSIGVEFWSSGAGHHLLAIGVHARSYGRWMLRLSVMASAVDSLWSSVSAGVFSFACLNHSSFTAFVNLKLIMQWVVYYNDHQEYQNERGLGELTWNLLEPSWVMNSSLIASCD